MSKYYTKEELLDLIVSKRWSLVELKNIAHSNQFPSRLFDIPSIIIKNADEVVKLLNEKQPILSTHLQNLLSLQRLIAETNETHFYSNELNEWKSRLPIEKWKVESLTNEFCSLINHYKILFPVNN